MITAKHLVASSRARKLCFHVLFIFVACQGATNDRRRPVPPQTRAPHVCCVCVSRVWLWGPPRGSRFSRARAPSLYSLLYFCIEKGMQCVY